MSMPRKNRQSSPEQNQERLLHPEELKHLIPEFSEGTGVTRWLQTIEHYAGMYGWTDATCLLYASCRLAGAALEWYNGFRNIINSYAAFRLMLVKAFPDHRNEADVHQELQQVAKQSNESYEHFVFRVNALGISGGVSTEAIIVYVIRGLSHDPIYESLISRQYEDIYQLLEHIKWCETNLHHRKKKESVKPFKQTTEERSLLGPSKPKGPFICYNCNEDGHKSINCPKPQRMERCSNCLQSGHTATGCMKKSVTATRSAVSTAGPSKLSTNIVRENNTQLESETKILSTDADSRVMAQVILGTELKELDCLVDSGSACYRHPEFRGPYLGPRPSEENRREFTEEQLRAGEGLIGLQAGSNKGATQAGLNFGATRKILLGK